MKKLKSKRILLILTIALLPISLPAQNQGYLLLNPATSICQSTTLKNFQDFFLDNEFILVANHNKNSIRTYLKENRLNAYLNLPLLELSGHSSKPLIFSEIQIKRKDTLLTSYQVCKMTNISEIQKLDMELRHLYATEKIPDTLSDYSFIDFDLNLTFRVYIRYPETALHYKDQNDLWNVINFKQLPYNDLISVLFTTEKERKTYIKNYEIVRKEFKKFIDIESFHLSDSLIIAGLRVYVPLFTNDQYLLNPYYILAIYDINKDQMNLFGINSKIRISASEYNTNFNAGFRYSTPGKLKLSLESKNGSKKYFLGNFQKIGSRFEFQSVFKKELPDFFQAKNLGYNFTDKIFFENFVLFKWSSDLYN